MYNKIENIHPFISYVFKQIYINYLYKSQVFKVTFAISKNNCLLKFLKSVFDSSHSLILLPAILFVKRKIQNSYLVWVQNSNKYIQLEEPAWFVPWKTVKRYKAATIASQFAVCYGHTPEESNDIRSGVKQMNQPDNNQGGAGKYPIELTNHLFKPYSIHRYRFGDHLIEFSFESCLFEY